VKLAAYYALLGLATWLLIRFVPSIPQLLARFREVSLLETVASRNRLVEEATAAAGTLSQGQWALVTFLSMLTALVLVLPVSWVYMLTKRRSGYDQSVVQTVIILPMTVAATVILVQKQLGLAFTLAAIVAAVRFRNTSKTRRMRSTSSSRSRSASLRASSRHGRGGDVRDVQHRRARPVAAERGHIYADQRGRVPALAPAEGLLGPRRRASAALAVGDPDLLAALAPHELEEVADRAARLQAYVMARAGDKKEERFNGMLLVHTTQPEAAQRVIEELLQVQARRWRLAEIVPAEQGRSSLEYLIRLRDEFLPATLLDALKGRGTLHRRRGVPFAARTEETQGRVRSPSWRLAALATLGIGLHGCGHARPASAAAGTAPPAPPAEIDVSLFLIGDAARRPRRPTRSRCSWRSAPRRPPRRTPSSCSWATTSIRTACPTRRPRRDVPPSACSPSSCAFSRRAAPVASSSREP